MRNSPLSIDVEPDWQALLACIMRKGTPQRVHHIELFLDGEIQQEICRRYGLLEGLDADDVHFRHLPRRTGGETGAILGHHHRRQVGLSGGMVGEETVAVGDGPLVDSGAESTGGDASRLLRPLADHMYILRPLSGAAPSSGLIETGHLRHADGDW